VGILNKYIRTASSYQAQVVMKVSKNIFSFVATCWSSRALAFWNSIIGWLYYFRTTL